MIKNSNGITLLSLIITIAVMMIIASVTVSTSMDRFEINNLNKMINDINFLKEKVSNYYLKYNSIPVVKDNNNKPIKYNYTVLEFQRNINDNENYYIVDLESMNDITLNYGKEGFENINGSDDTYIINEETHTIYYVKGVRKDDKVYHSVLDYYLVSDKIPPTAPEIKFISGKKNEEGIYITNIEVEIIPGKDALSGVARTEYSINGKGWKGLDEEDSDIVKKENNIIEIQQGDWHDIKARTIDVAGNISKESCLRLGEKDWEYAWVCIETTNENGETIREWDDTKYTPETLKDAQIDYAIIAKFYNEDTSIKPSGFVRNPNAGEGLEALGNIFMYKELEYGNEYEMIIEGQGEMPPLTFEVEVDGTTETRYYAWGKEIVNLLVGTTDTLPIISYVTSAKIEPGITNITSLTFVGAYSLKNVDIADTVVKIEPLSFAMCINLKQIDIPSSVLEIYDGAFIACLGLEEINVNSNNSKFSSKEGVLFNKEKTALIKYPIGKKDEIYNIPEGVETVSELSDFILIDILFRGWSKDLVKIPLKKLSIPSSFKDETFVPIYSYCENLEEANVHSDNPYFSSHDGIVYTKDFSKIVLYPMAKNAEIYVMPEGLTTIQNIDNTKIKRIELSSTVDDAGIAEQLSKLENLETIIVNENHPNLYSKDGILYNKDLTKIIKYPSNKEYKPEIIPNTVTVIGAYSFNNHKHEGNLKIPEGITSIEYYAFNKCNSIKTITFPETLLTIGNYAFAYCEKLESLVIPESVTTVGDSAFRKCNALKYAKVPLSTKFTSNTILGREAFCECESLTSIVLYGNKKTKIESYEINKFIAYSNITEIIIEAPITQIDHNAFWLCEEVKIVVLPETVKSIPEDILRYFTAFEKLQIMKTADEIKSMYYYPWGIPGKIYDKNGNLVE